MGPVRAELMWQAVLDAVEISGSGPLSILDLGGGTGSDAVRLAGLGHRLTVVDESPDALASLERRAKDAGAELTAVLADETELAQIPGAAEQSFDLVLIHGVLEHVPDPASLLANVEPVVRRGGHVSIIVPGRVAASTARAIAGDFVMARAIVETTHAAWDTKELGPRRYLTRELIDLIEATRFTLVEIAGLRAFTDLVPGALVEAGAEARAALVDLEAAARSHGEFVEHSGGLRGLARLD